jgi:tetratricopeptide (TPR) repeat protein
LKHGFLKTPEYCFFRGTMLHQLGEFAEAEASPREGFSLESDPHRKALASNTLGVVLMDMARYPEAMAAFEDAIRMWADRGTGHREVAEVWLRQGREPAEALDRARRALEIDRASPALGTETHNLRVAEDSALLAWAIAANSPDAQQVECLLAEAFPLCANSAKAIQAQVHFYAGHAYAALKMRAKSESHFKSNVNPNCSSAASPARCWTRKLISARGRLDALRLGVPRQRSYSHKMSNLAKSSIPTVPIRFLP